AALKILKIKPKEGTLGSLGPGEIVLDERSAKSLGVHAGGDVTIVLPRTPETTYRVKGIYRSAQLSGGVILPLAGAPARLRSALPIQASAKGTAGTSVSTVKQQVDGILTDSPEVTVQTRSEYVGQSTKIFNFLLGVVQVLLLVALLIAVLGIVNTLILSVLE